MTADALAVLQVIFSLIWQFFTSWYIPGTQTTPAAFFLFLGVAGLTIRFVRNVLSPNTSEVDDK